jgi:glucokinase
VAGWLSADREELLPAANLGVAGVPLRRDLERRLELPVAVENDGNAAALAEARAGAGVHARMLVMLTLGTGVGGGIVARGSLVTGAAGLAGELGHMPSGSDGPPCACGGRGCLEASASGPALALLAARAWRGKRPLSQVSAGDAEMAEDAVTGTDTVTAEDVATAARAGDRAAAGLLHAVGQAVGRAVARLVPVCSART